jgi:hypothetical protein
MWKISPDEVRALQGKGGQPFTEFVDEVIRAAVWIGGLPTIDVTTNLRTNLPDGGVDTTVARAVPGDSSGWLTEATAWQYKGTDWRNVNSAELLKGPRIRQLVQQGHAYRLAVADSLAEPDKVAWEKTLTAEVQKIAAAALPAMVLTSDDLAVWATRYPGLTARFKPGLIEKVRHLSAWQAALGS